MIPRSHIGWTDFSGGDANFVTGCTPVSEGCKNCYARAIYERFGKDFSQITYSSIKLENIMHAKLDDGLFNRRGAGSRPMVFVCDTGDLFHEWMVSSRNGYNAVLEAITFMRIRSDVDWQILTKRPQYTGIIHGMLYSNIWLGVTAENQARADERLPILMSIDARIRWVSVEPMLGPVNLRPYLRDGLSWVVCGGESGPHRRPFNPDWARALRDQCQAAGVPFFFKQRSALKPSQDDLLDGKQWHQWPMSEVLEARE